MPADRIEDVQALLVQAEEAHGEYEKTELNGVYDQEWPRWYADYAVRHGLGGLLGHDVAKEELAQFLAASYEDFQQADPKPVEPWATYIARRISAEL